MPYGYSVEQRLLMMQGYEDEEEGAFENDDGIVYGLEEVLRN